MFHIGVKYGDAGFYEDLKSELVTVLRQECNTIANLANMSSWLFHAIPDLNWCGFYLWSEQDQELVLGPFQGRPACIRIKPGRGVCGTSFSKRATLLVNDVEAFPGHIACDSASKSELVIPLVHANHANVKCYGVLDLDSPSLARFSAADAEGLEKLVKSVVPILFPVTDRG